MSSNILDCGKCEIVLFTTREKWNVANVTSSSWNCEEDDLLAYWKRGRRH